jgi:hypothetical protein
MDFLVRRTTCAGAGSTRRRSPEPARGEALLEIEAFGLTTTTASSAQLRAEFRNPHAWALSPAEGSEEVSAYLSWRSP